jgi:hypothetical protein
VSPSTPSPRNSLPSPVAQPDNTTTSARRRLRAMSAVVRRLSPSAAPSAVNSLRYSADCSGASRRAMACVAKCSTARSEAGSFNTCAAVASKPLSWMVSRSPKARVTARASSDE